MFKIFLPNPLKTFAFTLKRKINGRIIWNFHRKLLYLHREYQIEADMSTEAMTKKIAEYFKTQPVLKAWLFGSFSRGEEHADSDVDILIVLDHSQPVGLRFFGMWGDLERLLGRKVDLVTEQGLEEFARESANQDRILIYERAA